jgi:arsenate reductase
MLKVMFLCTGNACRSQMAEGFAREHGKGIITPFSAGIKPAGIVHPTAIAVMQEVRIDISGQKSKDIDLGLLSTMDIIVTLCGKTEESCAIVSPEIQHFHWAIDDPVYAKVTETEIKGEFRNARDEIWASVMGLIHSLQALRV